MGLFIREMNNPTSTVARLQGALLQAWDALTPKGMEVLVQNIPKYLSVVVAVI